MSHQIIQIGIHPDDIPQVINVVLNQIINRDSERRTAAVGVVNTAIASKDVKMIGDALREYIESAYLVQQDLNQAFQLIEVLDDSFPETEVLEDLPDLKEDSLGIDSGSEKPVNFPSNHSNE